MSSSDAWARWFWITFPRSVSVRLPALRGVAGDGHVITTLPVVALVAPAVVAVGGLLVGLFRLGYQDVYTESVLLLAALVAVGCLSGQLGVIALTGFVVGDLISTRPATGFDQTYSGSFWFSGPLGEGVLAHLVHIRVPRLITYLLLLAVVVILPRAARGAVAGLGRSRPVPPALAWVLVSGLVTVIVWLGADAWVAAAPTLVRPVFVWASSSGAPTAEAVQPFQTDGRVVVASAVLATLVRQVWIGAAMVPGALRERLLAAEATPPPAVAVDRQPRRRNPVVAAIGTSALATLTLAGILEHTLMWPVVFGAFFAVRWLRSDQVSPPWLDRWRRIVNRAPAWARLIGLWLASRFLVQSISNDRIGSYTALAVVVLVGVVAVFLIFPGDPRRRATAPAPTAEPVP